MSDAELNRVDALVDQLLEENPPATTDVRELWGAQYDLGLAWVWHDEGLGGLGLERRYQPHVNRRMNEAGASTDNRLFNLLGI